MIKMGLVYNVIDDSTIQVMDLDDDELYEIKGNPLSVNNIKENTIYQDILVDYDDESMHLID